MSRYGFTKIYRNILNKRPYLVQAIQTGTLMGTGDLLAQILVEKKHVREVDPKRVGRFASIGFFASGPGLRVWYGILDKIFESSKGSRRSIVLKKVFLDQFIFTPIMLCLLFVAIAVLQGKDVEALKKNLETNYFDVLKTNYAVWPCVQLFNFYYVPLQYQVLLVQVVALFWTMYLAWKTNK